MNVGDTRAEMLAYVAELRARLAGTENPTDRAALAEVARRRIEAARKRFKRRIDEQASKRFGFTVNARAGIVRKLTDVTAEALAAITAAADGLPRAV